MTRKVKNRDRRVAASAERRARKDAVLHGRLNDEVNDAANLIAQELDRDIIADMVGADYEARGFKIAPDDAEHGAIRYRSFAFKDVEWLMFVEKDSLDRKWWRPLTAAETMALIVEEET